MPPATSTDIVSEKNIATYDLGTLGLGQGGSDRQESPNRREYRCIFMRPGLVRQANGQDSNWLIPADVIARDAAKFNGVASYLDHPTLFGFGWRGEPQVKNLVGVTFDVHWDDSEQALVGSLRLYDEDPNSPGALVGALLDQMLADKDASLDVPPTGLSAVFYHKSRLDKETGLRITTEFRKVESVDVVYAPGAAGYVLSTLSALGANPGHQVSLNQPQHSQVSSQANSERSKIMPDNDTQEMPQDEALRILQGISTDIESISTRIEALEAVPPENPPDNPDLDALSAQVERLTGLLAERETPITGMGNAPRNPITAAHLTTGLDQIQAAWNWIFGVQGTTPPPPDLRRTDRLYYLLSGDGEWRGLFDERAALAAANATTLAGMVVNAMNKVIVPLYDTLTTYRWFEQIVTVQPTDGTLHDMAWIQFGGIANLPVVADGAAYSELTVDDSKESDAFTKRGGYVGITEKVLRNSDVARIQAVPRALTVAAVRTRSAAIASLFTANSGVGPTLDQDSTALFHANHGNLATTAYSIAAWKAARLECFKQTELNSAKRTGLWPKFWLGPADLYDTALIDFGYGAGPGGYTGTSNNDVNPYAASRPGDPRPIPLAVPEWTDTGDWAYLADPLMAPVIQMAYADNPGGGVHPAPQLYMVTSPTAGLMFTNDVLPIKVRDYWAYGVATYRGIGKRNVA